jgi:hypothetical protein
MTILVRNHDYLINNYPHPVVLGGIEYPSAEHAYQAAKYSDVNVKMLISKLSNPKNTGHNPDLKIDREAIMEIILRKKFDSELGEKLAKTGTEQIVMDSGTDWDTIIPNILNKLRTEQQLILGIDPSSCNNGDESDDKKYEPFRPIYELVTYHGEDDEGFSELANLLQNFYDSTNALFQIIHPSDFSREFVAYAHARLKTLGVDESVVNNAVSLLEKFAKDRKELNEKLNLFFD